MDYKANSHLLVFIYCFADPVWELQTGLSEDLTMDEFIMELVKCDYNSKELMQLFEEIRAKVLDIVSL